MSTVAQYKNLCIGCKKTRKVLRPIGRFELEVSCEDGRERWKVDEWGGGGLYSKSRKRILLMTAENA